MEREGEEGRRMEMAGEERRRGKFKRSRELEEEGARRRKKDGKGGQLKEVGSWREKES